MVISDPQTYSIIGAAMEVHTLLGHGFLERVYHDALAHELALRSIPFEREGRFDITYKGRQLDSHYRADLVYFGNIVVEIKSL